MYQIQPRLWRGFHRPWIKHEYIRYAANVLINVSYISIYENFEISSFKSKTSTLTVLTSPPNIRFPLVEMHEMPAVQNKYYLALACRSMHRCSN